MNKPVNNNLKQLIYNKGYRYVLEDIQIEEGILRAAYSLAESRWNKGDVSYIDNLTIADVVMWLYEKHGIWISVDCDCYGELWYAKLSVASENNWNNIDLRHEIVSATKKFPNEHNTSTEAYEAAIKYCLENLVGKSK